MYVILDKHYNGDFNTIKLWSVFMPQLYRQKIAAKVEAWLKAT